MRPELQVANTFYTWIKLLMSSGAEGQWRRCPELFFIVFVFGGCEREREFPSQKSLFEGGRETVNLRWAESTVVSA